MERTGKNFVEPKGKEKEEHRENENLLGKR
jgi:hypothetical protein